MRRWLWLPLLFTGIVGTYLACWYLQSPVAAGIYPARVGGTHLAVEPDEELYKLPVIWVRPHPWAATPPALARVDLLAENGPNVSISGEVQARAPFWPEPGRPVWLQKRAVLGYIAVPVAAERVTFAGVRFRWPDGQEELYANGRITFQRAVLKAGNWSAPGSMNQLALESRDLKGNYLVVEGHGTLVDVISALPGTAGELRYKEGLEAFGANREPWREYQPLSLPMAVDGRITIYIPAVPERLRDTFHSTRHGIVVQTDHGEAVVAAATYQWGMMADHTAWRYWTPYFLYQPAQKLAP